MGPEQSTIPVDNAQAAQSAATQAGAHQTGADLLTSMTQARLNSLYQTQDKLNDAIFKTAGAASTPVPVTDTKAINVPGQHQWQNAPLISSQAYSRSGSIKRGVGNLITGVANVVGASITKEQNNKNKALSLDIERLLEAQNGIESAKQVLQQDPNNAEAKATIQKNSDIMNSLLDDPKKRKQISKAFDINFIDPSQNNSPEHAALKQATKSYADQLQEKLPIQMAPNAQAQARLGQLTQLSDTISNQIKAASSDRTAEALLRFQTEQDKLAQRQQEEANKQNHWHDQLLQRSQQFQQQLQERMQATQLMANSRIGAAQIAAQSRLAAVDKNIQGRIAYARQNGATSVQMARVVNDAIKNYSNELNKIPTEILQFQTLYNKKDASPQDKEYAQQQINAINDNKTYLQDQIQNLQNQETLLTNSFTGVNFNESTGSNDGGSDNVNSPNWKPPAVEGPVRPSKEHKDTKPATPSTPPPVQPTGPKSDSSGISVQQLVELIKNS